MRPMNTMIQPISPTAVPSVVKTSTSKTSTSKRWRSRLPKLLSGSLACTLLLPGISSLQGANEFESNFSAQRANWNTSGNWTRVTGVGDIPKTVADSVKIIALADRRDIIVNVDDIHINLLEYAAPAIGVDPDAQYIFADGTRTLTVNTLTKNGSQSTAVANGKISNVEQSLSLVIGDLNINSGTFNIGFGTSTNSIGGLDAFNVTGKTTVSTGTSLFFRGVQNRNPETNHIQLGHLQLSGTGKLVLGGNGNSTGTVEVFSLSGNGLVRVGDNSTNNGTAGTLHINSKNASAETFSGTLQDYINVNNPAKLTILKTGTGTQVFSRSAGNTYSGTTTINEGVLAVTNTTTTSSGLGTGPVEVGGTGILAGKGFIAPGTRLVFADEEDEDGTEVGNTITVHTGGSIAPSAHLLTHEATKLTLNGADNLGATILDMEEGSSFRFRLGADNTSDSLHFSNYHAGGLQLFSGGIDVNVLGIQEGVFNLLTFSSITENELDTLAGLLNAGSGFGGYTATFYGDGTTISLQVDAIPEPRETALLLMGLAGLVGWRRYQKRQSIRLC